jgi:hypothetical protein
MGKPFVSKTDAPSPSSSSDATPMRDIRGGILLRTIRREEDKVVVCGPSLLVDEILKQSGTDSLTELVQLRWFNDSCAFREPLPEASGEGDKPSPAATRTTRLYVEPYKPKSTTFATVYTSPRIGLELSNTRNQEDRIKFVDQPYRFFIDPAAFKDKGRAQTFVGLLRHFKANSKKNEPPFNQYISKIEGVSAIPTKVATRLLACYTEGWKNAQENNSKSLGEFLGQNGKGVCQVPDKIVKMMGALEKTKAQKAASRVTTGESSK